MVELLPCPFCGRYPINYEYRLEYGEKQTKHCVKVECSCGITLIKTLNDIGLNRLINGEKLMYNETDIMALWNTRTKERGGENG